MRLLLDLGPAVHVKSTGWRNNHALAAAHAYVERHVVNRPQLLIEMVSPSCEWDLICTFLSDNSPQINSSSSQKLPFGGLLCFALATICSARLRALAAATHGERRRHALSQGRRHLGGRQHYWWRPGLPRRCREGLHAGPLGDPLQRTAGRCAGDGGCSSSRNRSSSWGWDSDKDERYDERGGA